MAKFTNRLLTELQTNRVLQLYLASLVIHLLVGLTISDQIMYPLLKDVANNLWLGNGYSFYVVGKPRPFVAYPPAYPFFMILCYSLGLAADVEIRLIQMVFTSFTPLVITSIVEKISRRKVPIHVFALICLWPITLTADSALGAQGFTLLASVVSIRFLVGDATEFNNYMSIAFGVIATLFRPEATLLLLFSIIVVFLRAKCGVSKRVAILVLALIPYVPWVIFLSKTAGGIALTPPGAGLNAISVIGKWDRASGLPYGDGEVLKWEGQPDIFYPDPFKRDQIRLKRAIEYISENPARYVAIVTGNSLAMNFGQKLYIKENRSSLQAAVFRGDIREFALSNPVGILQRLFASGATLISILLGFYSTVKIRSRDTLIILTIGILYALFAGLFGVLARYTWIGLHAWMILMFVGFVCGEFDWLNSACLKVRGWFCTPARKAG